MLIMMASVFSQAQNPRNIIIYDLTSTDCGSCSCMDSLLGKFILPQFPRTIVIALHGIGSYYRSYHGSDIVNYFRSEHEPSGFMDGQGYDISSAQLMDSVTSRYSMHSQAPVSIQISSKTWNPATRKVDFTMTLTNLGNSLPGAYYFNVFVTENNLKHQHRIFEGCSTPDDPSGLPLRNNYINHWVIRDVVYDVAGDSLIGPNWPSMQALVKSCSFLIDTSWIPENCNFNIVAYRNDSLYKANVQQSLIQSVTRPLDIIENSSAQDAILKIFPNPAPGQSAVHISISKEGLCRLVVEDMNGREVDNLLNGFMKPGLYNVEMDAGRYPAGLYFVVLTSPGGSFKAKFIRP